MDAADEAAKTFQRVGIVQLGRTATVAAEHRKAKTGVAMQGGAIVQAHGRHDGHFFVGQLLRKSMFFEDLFVSPAQGR
jgi:nucleoid DNA-binding protein